MTALSRRRGKTARLFYFRSDSGFDSQSSKWQGVGRGVKDSLGVHAVGIIEVIRDEQTGVRVKAHAALIALLFTRQQN
jgi:hypothetical protein